jgi:hypothetical protein
MSTSSIVDAGMNEQAQDFSLLDPLVATGWTPDQLVVDKSNAWMYISGEDYKTNLLDRLCVSFPVTNDPDELSAYLATALCYCNDRVAAWWIERGAKLVDDDLIRYRWLDLFDNRYLSEASLVTLLILCMRAGVTEFVKSPDSAYSPTLLSCLERVY